MSEYLYMIYWFLVLELIGFAAFPIVSNLCGNLYDRGYSLSKILGLMILTFTSWIITSLHIIKFGIFNIYVSFSILVLISALIIYVNRIDPAGLFKSNFSSITKIELIFAVSFFLFLIIPMNSPNIYFAYSEDFMDYGFMKSIMRAEYFPPPDPWFAGSTLSYYYGGHLIMAILTLLSGVPSFISYNMGGAMFFALAAAASYGLGYNLTKKSIYGLLCAFFVTFIGFLSGFLQLVVYLSPGMSTALGYESGMAQNLTEWFKTYAFHDINRIIPYTLNFYPGFIFMQGDLHGQMVSIPFQVAFILYIYGSLIKKTGNDSMQRFNKIFELLVSGMFLGFFLLIHTWNYPTFVIFTGFTIALVTFRKIKSVDEFFAAFPEDIYLILKKLINIVIISIILYSPYLIFSSSRGFLGIGFIGGRTRLVEFLEIFALFMFILVTFILFMSRSRQKEAAVIIIASLILALLTGFELLIIMLPMILISGYWIVISLNRKDCEHFVFILLLVITGGLLALFCDFFYISDVYTNPYNRFNTVMKIYVEMWIFFGIASASSLFFILGKSPTFKGFADHAVTSRRIWMITVLFLFLASAISPVAMSLTLTGNKETLYGKPPYIDTLNGLDYLIIDNFGDMLAIDWIDNNIEGSHVIVEAPGEAYEYSSRISALTGLPTIIGWKSHETTWRSFSANVNVRSEDVEKIYNSTNNTETLELLQKYNAKFIYIGKIEREKYASEGLQKFETYPEYYAQIYNLENVLIYEIK